MQIKAREQMMRCLCHASSSGAALQHATVCWPYCTQSAACSTPYSLPCVCVRDLLRCLQGPLHPNPTYMYMYMYMYMYTHTYTHTHTHTYPSFFMAKIIGWMDGLVD